MRMRGLKSVILAGLTGAAMLGGVASAQTWRPPVATFNGKTSVTFAPDPSLELGKYGTIEFWVQPKWTASPGYDPVILSYLGDAGPLYTVVMTADRKAIGLMAGKDWDLAQVDFTDGKLHHVALVVIGEATEVYIDGKHDDTLMIGFGSGAGRSFHIGTLDGASSPFNGGIAGLRIWNTPLEAADIDTYKLVDIFSPQGRKHPDFDALVGASDFSNGGMKFNLTHAFPPSAQRLASAATPAPAKAPQ